MTETMDKWRRLYGADKGNEDDFVLSHYDTAQLWKKKGNQSKYLAEGKLTVDAWKQRGSIKKGKGAALAAEFALMDIEVAYATWEKYQITTQITSTKVPEITKQLVAIRTALEAKKTAIEDKYLSLDAFDLLEYSLAAKVRFGDIAMDSAEKLQNMPVPKLFANNPDVMVAYTEQLDANTKKFLDQAKKQWEETVAAGKAAGVSNRWTRLALEELAREFPDQYKALRQELIQGTDTP
jgi:hypothetical protein